MPTKKPSTPPPPRSRPLESADLSLTAALKRQVVTITELRKNLKDHVGSIERTVVTRDNQPASVLMHVKDFMHREALLDWALDDPEGWADAMAAHRRVQREGVRGVEIDELLRQRRQRRAG